jgi:hypothetical protein
MSSWNTNAASLIVDIHHVRCGNCKVRVDDRLAERCPTCGATFERVVSNHVGLADRLTRERSEHSRASVNVSPTATGTSNDAGRHSGTVIA